MSVRSFCLACVIPLAGMPSTAHAADPYLYGTASAHFGTSTVTFPGGYEVIDFPMSDVGTTSVQHFHCDGSGPTPGPGDHRPLLTLTSVATSNLPAGAIGASTYAIIESVAPLNNTAWQHFSTGRARYQDNITVSSSTLPAGTDVIVTFHLHVEWNASAFHDIAPLGGTTNYHSYLISAGASFTSSTFEPVSPPTSVHLNSNNHKKFFTTAGGTTQTVGIFDEPDHHLEVPITSHVGDTILVFCEIALNMNGAVVATFPGGITFNHNGEVCGSLGLAFGATPADPSVVLTSQRLGGPFPPGSQANAGNAAANAPVATHLCPGPTPPLAIAQWRSMRSHTGFPGSLPILLNSAASGDGISGPTTESRLDGIQVVEADFTAPASVGTAAVTVTGQTTLGGVPQAPVSYPPTLVSMVDADTVSIAFDPGLLPDQTCYTIDISPAQVPGLGGDHDVMIRGLAGDVSSSGLITLSDALATQARIGQFVPDHILFDLDLSGGITLLDALAAKARIGNQALCP